MLKELKNYFNCCLYPKKDMDVSSITQEKETPIKEINEEENQKKNILFKPSNSNLLLHLKSIRAAERKKSNISIKSKNSNKSNLSIVTFSNSKVKKNHEYNNKVLDTLVVGTHELILEGEIFYNKTITIDRIGIKNLRRKNQNGITIFGVSDDNTNDENNNDNNNNNNDNEKIIDFNLNISKNKLKKNLDDNIIQIFSIEYDKIEEHYFLTLLNLEYKMLLYIDYNFLIENNTTTEFMVGKILMSIKSPKDEKDNIFSILVEGKEYEFDKSKDCPITIGRTNSKINIKNNSISKNHAIIDYQYDNEVICIKDNESTNGTYFVIGEKCSFVYLLSDLTFKFLDNKFTVKLSYE